MFRCVGCRVSSAIAILLQNFFTFTSCARRAMQHHVPPERATDFFIFKMKIKKKNRKKNSAQRTQQTMRNKTAHEINSCALVGLLIFCQPRKHARTHTHEMYIVRHSFIGIIVSASILLPPYASSSRQTPSARPRARCDITFFTHFFVIY